MQGRWAGHCQCSVLCRDLSWCLAKNKTSNSFFSLGVSVSVCALNQVLQVLCNWEQGCAADPTVVIWQLHLCKAISFIPLMVTMRFI